MNINQFEGGFQFMSVMGWYGQRDGLFCFGDYCDRHQDDKI